jgi:dUTP pyrophosphatase
MQAIQVKFKRLVPEAQIPKKANPSDSGFDLTAVSEPIISEDGYVEYDTGIAVAPPEGYYCELFARSSISKYDLTLCNGVGIIDFAYRNSIKVRFKMPNRFSYQSYDPNEPSVGFCPKAKIYKKGDRIAQIIFKRLEPVVLVEIQELDQTDRGLGGFGSTGS